MENESKKRNTTSKYNDRLNFIGNNLKKYRELRNLSLADLSAKLQLIGIYIHTSSLQNIEVGKRIVKEYEFYALCTVLDVSMEEMLSDFINELKE